MKSSKKDRKSLVGVLDRVATPGSARVLTQLISKTEKKEPIMMSSETALALIISCGLSQDDYQKIRNSSKEHNADIFPSYHKVINLYKIK